MGKKICLVLGQILMLYITWLIFSGSLAQVKINMDVEAPVTGMSVGIFYGAGVVFSVSAGFLLLRELWRVLSGKVRDEDLVMVKESEEAGELEELQAQLARENAQLPATVDTHPGAKS